MTRFTELLPDKRAKREVDGGMSSLKTELVKVPDARRVAVTADTLTVELSDARVMSVPLAWYPRLLHGTP